MGVNQDAYAKCSIKWYSRCSVLENAAKSAAILSATLHNEYVDSNFEIAVCCGVRGRALASHTDVRGFEPQCGGRLSSSTC